MAEESVPSDFEEETEVLDRIVPDDVNRRRFLQSTVAGLVATSFAGCQNQQGGQEPTQTPIGTTESSTTSTEASDDLMRKDGVTWRQAFQSLPMFSQAFHASLNGDFEDAGVVAPEVLAGTGSADTAQRVGTGAEEIGMVNDQIIPGLAEGYDLTAFGLAKSKSINGLMYRPEIIDDPTNLEGTTIATDPTEGATLLEAYADLEGFDYSEVDTVDAGDPGTILDAIASGEADAAFHVMHFFTMIRLQLPDDMDLAGRSFWKTADVFGHSLVVNSSWYSDTSDGVEYVSRLLEGYSHAQKWWLLNPDEALDQLINTINPGLQANPRPAMAGQQKASMAMAVSEAATTDGLGYPTESIFESTFDTLSSRVVDDPSQVPSVDEFVDTTPADNADLAVLSDDEVEQVREYVGDEIWDFYN